MNFIHTWFSPAWQLGGAALWLLLAAWCAPAFARTLAHAPKPFYAATALAACFWLIGATVEKGHLAGMGYHLLGINLAALMAGWRSAVWIGSLLALLHSLRLHGAEMLTVLPLNIVLTVLPSCICHALLGNVVQRLPKQLFVYIFVRGFLGSALSMLCTGIAVIAALALVGFERHFITSALPVFFLLSWSEAFLSGIATALLVAFKPQWLRTFDESGYLCVSRQIWK